jgi:Type II CAAX prenyl endopeptidase Rce1-like
LRVQFCGCCKLFTVWALLEGLVFGWLYQLTGNLLVPMIVHGVHDSAGMFFGRYLYGRFIPPAATLSDWLRALSGPAVPITPAATAQVPQLPVTPTTAIQAQEERVRPAAAKQALQESAAPIAAVQALKEPSALDAPNTIEPALVESEPSHE